MNLGLLILNLLPIYPLDGGQILRALLWYKIGRARSLRAAVIVGFVGIACLLGLAIWAQSIWIGIMAGFALMNCVSGWKQAQAMLRVDEIPRHAHLECPECHEHPFAIPMWKCPGCGEPADFFAGPCPKCGASPGDAGIPCVVCRKISPVADWTLPHRSPTDVV